MRDVGGRLFIVSLARSAARVFVVCELLAEREVRRAEQGLAV